MPTAYSYLRFSTPDQLKGDSSRRQLELSETYARDHGLTLDASLAFHDLGVSAYRGDNVERGALGAFLTAVETGRVADGAWLLVESLDRLTRGTILDALNLFQRLLSRGLTIVTLSDGKQYTRESLNNLGDLIVSLSIMARAHEESEMKSKRLAAAWKAKRQRATSHRAPLTGQCPAWLTLKDGEFGIIEARAEVVRRMFDLTLKGYGKGHIARTLNEEGVPTFGRSTGWHASYIQKILNNEAVVSTYQPHRKVSVDGARRRVPEGAAIKGYFPPVVDEVTFLRARQVRGERRIASGPKGKTFSNLLQGLAVCAGDCPNSPAPMNYVNKGHGVAYLACSSARRGIAGCGNSNSWRYGMVLFPFLHCIGELDWSRLYPEMCSQAAAALRVIEGRLTVLNVEVRALEDGVARLVDAFEQQDASAALHSRLAAREIELAEKKSEANTLADESTRLEADLMGAEANDRLVSEEYGRWMEEAGSDDSLVAYDANARMNQVLRHHIARVDFPCGGPSEGHITVHFKGGAEQTITIHRWPARRRPVTR